MAKFEVETWLQDDIRECAKELAAKIISRKIGDKDIDSWDAQDTCGHWGREDNPSSGNFTFDVNE